MHLIKSEKKKAPEKLVPIVSQFRVPGVRKMRGRRYDVRGQDIGPCGPAKPKPDRQVQAMIERAHAEAAKKPFPEEGNEFDIRSLRPLAGRILVARGKLIKEENGVALPENKWRHAPGFLVVAIGTAVTDVSVGDTVLFVKTHRPRSIKDLAGYCLAREAAVAAILE